MVLGIEVPQVSQAADMMLIAWLQEVILKYKGSEMPQLCLISQDRALKIMMCFVASRYFLTVQTILLIRGCFATKKWTPMVGHIS
ncbi:hypothetical protein AK966_18010 [Vibrio sp. PID23_8]|nr:hypothetical protein AK966_18010 [Vibrio sp. PID23_8]